MSDIAPRDKNRIAALLGTSNVDGESTVKIYADPVTHRLFVESSGGGVASSLQTDVFTATNNQTIFTASQTTVAYTLYLSLNGAIQTPNVDYSVTGNVATLTSGVPSGTIVVWLYATS